MKFINLDKKIIYAGLALAIVLAGVFGYHFFSSQEQYPIKRILRYSLTVTNKTNSILKEQSIWVFAPVKKSSNQKTINISASHPYQMVSDKFGNQLLHFQFDKILPYAAKVISIDTVLDMSDEANRIKLNNEKSFLAAEKFIETDNQDLKKLVAQLLGNGKWESEKNIFKWVSSGIKYSGYIAEDRGALYAYQSGQGDCTEYSYLFTALSRIAGIPTRSIGGVVYSEDKLLNNKDFHNWSEVYIDGAWHVIDPQRKVFAQNQSNYIALRILPGEGFTSLNSSQGFMRASPGLQLSLN